MTGREQGAPSWMAHVDPGRLDRRVLDQRRFWVTRQGAVLELSAMSVEHLHAVTDLLRDKPMWLHMHAMADLLTGAVEGVGMGEVLAVELGGASIADLDAEEWLATTPLMRAFESETRRR